MLPYHTASNALLLYQNVALDIMVEVIMLRPDLFTACIADACSRQWNSRTLSISAGRQIAWSQQANASAMLQDAVQTQEGKAVVTIA